MKLLSINLALLLLLLLTASYLESAMAGPVVTQEFCDGKCGVRCSKAGKQSRCLKYCKMCCLECGCVPSGTYGNKDECACYRDKVSSGPIKRNKCP